MWCKQGHFFSTKTSAPKTKTAHKWLRGALRPRSRPMNYNTGPRSGVEGPWDQGQDPRTTTPGPEVVSRHLETKIKTWELKHRLYLLHRSTHQWIATATIQRGSAGSKLTVTCMDGNYDLPSHTDMTVRRCEDQDCRCQDQDQCSQGQDQEQDRHCQDQAQYCPKVVSRCLQSMTKTQGQQHWCDVSVDNRTNCRRT